MNKGFSLLELMIVVGIIGILASIALPTYNGYVTSAAAIDGTTNLASYKVNLERFFQDNRTYAGASSCPGDCGIPCDATGGSNTGFTYSCFTSNGGMAFTLTANGAGRLAGVVYTIDQQGVKTTAITGGGTGWDGSGTRWITK